jgi:uncharacterized membrane protein HdeD (DUF308 family)
VGRYGAGGGSPRVVDVAGGAVLRAVSARRLPWWLVLLFGVAAVVVGVWLTAEPFRSLPVLIVLVVAGLC